MSPEREAEELRKKISKTGQFLRRLGSKDYAMTNLFWVLIFKLNKEFRCWMELARIRNAVFRANGIDEARPDKVIADMLCKAAERYRRREPVWTEKGE
jgi:hypothetical protein